MGSSFFEIFTSLVALSQFFDIYTDRLDIGTCWKIKDLTISLQKDGVVFTHGRVGNVVQFKVPYKEILIKDTPIDGNGKNLHFKIGSDSYVDIPLTPIDIEKEKQKEDSKYLDIDYILENINRLDIPNDCPFFTEENKTRNFIDEYKRIIRNHLGIFGK